MGHCDGVVDKGVGHQAYGFEFNPWILKDGKNKKQTNKQTNKLSQAFIKETDLIQFKGENMNS